MKPDEVSHSMKTVSDIHASVARETITQIDANSMCKLEAAYDEAVATGGVVEKLQSLYKFLKNPPKSIMDGEEIKHGVASLCIGLVVLCRSKGITVLLEKM